MQTSKADLLIFWSCHERYSQTSVPQAIPRIDSHIFYDTGLTSDSWTEKFLDVMEKRMEQFRILILFPQMKKQLSRTTI